MDRRHFVATSLVAPSLLRGTAPFARESADHSAQSAVPAEFPRQASPLAFEMVQVAHGGLDRVIQLLADRPALAHATYDWGYGDWETAIGAASHTGQVEIADRLIGAGAQPTLFTAAMLGQVDVVRAVVRATPGIQRTAGPHGISLLAHARAGRDRATAVVEYLTSLGDADPAPPDLAVDPADRARILGAYAFGPGEGERLTVMDREGTLMVQRPGAARRSLLHSGGLRFAPIGAPSVHLTFVGDAGTPMGELIVTDGSLVVRCRRVS